MSKLADTPPTAAALDALAYPALFSAADGTSRTGQAWYTGFVRADLILVVCAAALTAASGIQAVVPPTAAIVLRGISVAMLVLALVARTTNRVRRPEREWFDGRAVAESAKTTTWKYMMRTQPYDGDDSEADGQLLSDFRSLIQDRRALPYATAILTHGGEQITPRMRAVRSMPWQDRRDLYVAQRVQDQERWYAGKAQASRTAAAAWFWVGWLAQGAALGLSIVSLVVQTLPNVIGVLTSVAAAATGWTQLRRHDELAQSYAVAAQELSLSASELSSAPDEAAFLKGVQQAEDSISREHKLWVARRQ